MSKINTGFMLVKKPIGPTSHDIVNKLRNITGIRKIGHAGTLDPFASGLLIVAIGREATRSINDFLKKDKEYIATLYLGSSSDTGDRTGQIKVVKKNISGIEINLIMSKVKNFIGEQKQVPPMFSAKKINGRKLYELARIGIEVERKPNIINIYRINLLSFKPPLLKLKIDCSSGTYIRSLAYDIGKKLGTGAYLAELKRTAIGNYKLKKAISINELNNSNWRKYLFD
jgi:tRNA pseudouridine55 synthase